MFGSLRNLGWLAALSLAAPRAVIQVPPSAPRDDGANDVVLPAPVWNWAGRKGAGVSMAAQKRASAKRRNVKRNRAAHRG